MSTFKVGQKVVCKNNRSKLGIIKELTEGKVYTVESVSYCSSCNGETLSLCELHGQVEYPGLNWMICGNDNCEHPFFIYENFSFMSWRFEPLKFDLLSNKEIIETIIKETVDVPLLVPEYN